MAPSELLDRFHACRRYKQARSWQKPFIDPRRFVKNQLRSRGWGNQAVGTPCVAATFHLPDFTVVEGEGVSRELESYGIFEDKLTEAFLQLIQPGQVVVDIGMHLGYYATLFACLVTERGEVHAFEPTPSTRELAHRNVARFRQVVVHPEAVWSSVTSLEFRDYGVAWMAFNSFTSAKTDETPEPKMFNVETTTLDRLRETLGKPVTVVKIDAESAEGEILAGAQNLIQLDRPLISVEVGDNDGSANSRSLVDHLQSLHYTPWEFADGRFMRHEPRNAYSYDNLIFAPSSRDLS